MTAWGAQIQYKVKHHLYSIIQFPIGRKKCTFSFGSKLWNFPLNFLLLLHKAYQSCGTEEDGYFHPFFVKETVNNCHKERIKRVASNQQRHKSCVSLHNVNNVHV